VGWVTGGKSNMKHRHAVRPKEPDGHIGQALAVGCELQL